MGGTTSIFYSGAVQATAGTVVSGAVSSFTRTCEMEEGLDVTLCSLRHEVSKIQCAISAARGRKITDQKLLKWLAQIINAAYLGNYYNRRFKNQSSFPSMIESEGTNNFNIYPTGHTAKRQRTIKNLLFGNDDLKELHDVLQMLKSIDMCAFILMVNAQPERPMKRYLYMDHHMLINRDKEKEQVMQFLLEPSTIGENYVDVLPIVGSSGVGKTSLVLHCFYDPKVQNHFSLKIYISSTYMAYPNNHGIPKIFEQILERCNCPDASNFDENTVVAMLKQYFSSERLLLVIDNVWRWDFAVWNVLLRCLRRAKKGSKVIFASNLAICNEYMAIANSGPVKLIMLDGFSEDEYMLFFKEHAFGGADPEDFPELAKMGEDIAKKMNGSIWGAKIIGELLRDNLNAPFWSIFLQNDFLSAEFMQSKDLLPVSKTVSQLLPKRPQVNSLIRTWGESAVHCLCHELKSFRELMVLSPKYCTPVIKEGKNYGVQFLVAKHFNLYETTVFTAICEPVGQESRILLGESLWIDIDDQ